MESLKFSIFQLIIDNKKPNMSSFKNISNENFSHKETTYVISCEAINNRFFWIYAKYGNSLPYSNEVVNTTNSELLIIQGKKNMQN